MSMKKALDQTIRDLKRGVNKKVLKVPSVEQKVLDATSNEPWGPHGSLLADIAQASRNYHEYQMIMAVIWKRINDTGKNWRHVYKALTVLEYLVTNGSERVIDEIREHAYQISTLSDFQYIDSSGRDQGNNVRRKSQSLVLLVNDKERIQEIREKAAGNRDKFRGNNSVGGMSRSSSGGFSDDRYEGRYGGKEDEHNGYGREREQGFRDDERYGRHGDSHSREGDRYRKDSEHYGKDSYRDEDSRSQNVDDYQYGSRSRSSERNRDRAYDDDDQHSSRGNSVKGQDHPSDGRPIERKFSEQNLAAPPSYEDAVGDSKTSTYSERDREIPAASPPQLSSPTADPALQSAAPTVNTVSQSSLSSTDVVNPSQGNTEHAALSHLSMGSVGFDEFDPRGSFAATPSTSKIAEIDLLGSLSDVFSANPLAIMPVSSGTTDSVADVMEAAPNPTFRAATSTSNVSHQPFGDPFGDSPFKAVPSDEPQNFDSTSSLQLALTTTEATVQKVETSTNIGFTDAFSTSNFNPADIPQSQTFENSQYFSQEPQPTFDNDILAGIFPPAGPLPTSQMPPANPTQSAFSPPTVFSSQPPTGGFMPQSESIMSSFSHMNVSSFQHSHHQSSLPYSLSSTALTQYVPQQAQSVTVGQQNNNFLVPQAGPPGMLLSAKSAPPSSVSSFIPQQPPKEKFEPKSTVWADTLSKGLVDFNISGSKTNPLSDIGVDFESLNRKEKRMEKQPSTAPPTSNVSMGKAMGSGSGIGRSSGGGMRPPQMGPGIGMGMGMGSGPTQSAAMGVGNYGSVNQQPMGGMGMGMGMPQGLPMQPPNGTNIGNYNPVMGRGGYSQQPYGGGYR